MVICASDISLLDVCCFSFDVLVMFGWLICAHVLICLLNLFLCSTVSRHICTQPYINIYIYVYM